MQAQEAAREAQAASTERLEELRARITSRQRLLDSDEVQPMLGPCVDPAEAYFMSMHSIA